MMKQTRLALTLATAWMVGALAPTLLGMLLLDQGAPIPEPSNMALAATGAVLTALAVVRSSDRSAA